MIERNLSDEEINVLFEKHLYPRFYWQYPKTGKPKISLTIARIRSVQTGFLLRYIKVSTRIGYLDYEVTQTESPKLCGNITLTRTKKEYISPFHYRIIGTGMYKFHPDRLSDRQKDFLLSLAEKAIEGFINNDTLK
jgi:hypothetical protein